MKKLISLLLAIMLFLTISVPVFAAPPSPSPPLPPVPTSRESENLYGETGLNEISAGELEFVTGRRAFKDANKATVTDLIVSESVYLQINQGSTIEVTGRFQNEGLITVYGTLIVNGQVINSGVINIGIFVTTGKLIGPKDDTSHTHTFENGVCTVCGTHQCAYLDRTTYNNGICANCGFVNESFHVHNFEDGICTSCNTYECQITGNHDYSNGVCICGEEKPEDEEIIPTEGSVLSKGNIWIIVAVAAVVIGGVVALFIVKKKSEK